MSSDRFVVVGVTRARARWVADLARWSTDGAAPVEFVSCLTATEAAAVLGTGRRVSALLLDARGPGIDRDLIDAAAGAGTPSLVVTDGSVHRDWEALGCAAVIDDRLDPATLVEALKRHARPVGPARRPGRSVLSESVRGEGLLVAVTGPGGGGASSAAMALAQAAATTRWRYAPDEPAESTSRGTVALVDGCARGSLAMYHHIGDVVPGLPELVESHRSDRLDPDEVRRITFPVPTRHYSLLLGRRRISDWVTLRRRSADAALDAMCRAFDTVIVDFDAELDNQADTGSSDVEDRHSVNLAAVDRAHLVLVVARGDLHGLHGLTTLTEDLLDAGVPAHRLVPVISSSPRSASRRTLLRRQVSKLFDSERHADIADPVMLSRARAMDEVHDRVAPLPSCLVDPLGRHVLALADSLPPRPTQGGEVAERVRPGELGTDIDDRVQLFARNRRDVA